MGIIYMKALTLTQPWATLVAIGAKRIETRSWATSFRGTIAIHAAKGWPRSCRDLVFEHPFDEVLIKHFGIGTNIASALEIQNLPTGAILATAHLVDCVPTENVPKFILNPPSIAANSNEGEFGDYCAGRWAWILDKVHALKIPIPCKGALGLWDIPSVIVDEIAHDDPN